MVEKICGKGDNSHLSSYVNCCVPTEALFMSFVVIQAVLIYKQVLISKTLQYRQNYNGRLMMKFIRHWQYNLQHSKYSTMQESKS